MPAFSVYEIDPLHDQISPRSNVETCLAKLSGLLSLGNKTCGLQWRMLKAPTLISSDLHFLVFKIFQNLRIATLGV